MHAPSQMVVEPELRIPDFAKAGADIVSVHCEQSSTIHLHRVLNQVRHHPPPPPSHTSANTMPSGSSLHQCFGSQIKDYGMKAGVVLNPATPLTTIEYVLDVADLVLIMSVNPGFGGQKFIESQVDKIRALKQMCSLMVGAAAGTVHFHS